MSARRAVVFIAGLIVVLQGTLVCAQGSPVGEYEGSFENDLMRHPQTGRSVVVYQTVRILSVEGEQVSGTFTMHAGACQGEYPLTGRFENGLLQLTAERRGACGGARMSLRHVNDALEGRVGPREMRLTRQ